MSPRLLFAGGGTGGHIFPLVAVAQAVRAAAPEVEIVFVGTARGMEMRVLGDLGEKLELLDDLVYESIGGNSQAMQQLHTVWPTLKTELDEIKEIKVAMTLIGGEVVWER